MSPSTKPERPSLQFVPAMLTSPTELLVWWAEPETEDPENPMNWSPLVKWANILTLSVISFLV